MPAFAVVAPDLIGGARQLAGVGDQVRAVRDRLVLGLDARIGALGPARSGTIGSLEEACAGALSRLLADLADLDQALQTAGGTYVQADSAVLRQTGRAG